MKKIFALFLTVLLAFGALTVTASAFESYSTYTYSIDGEVLESPVAYSATASYDGTAMGITGGSFGNTKIEQAKDIVTDYAGNVYIADSGVDEKDNGRILILDYSYRAKEYISAYVDEFGRDQQLKKPSGIFVTDAETSVNGEKELFVCDYGNAQIVIFRFNANLNKFEYNRTVKRPETKLLDTTTFQPESIAVDKYGKMFVISPSCEKGVIVMTETGAFTGFIGAQKVTGSVWDKITDKFLDEEQKAAKDKKLSASYRNITVDADGFIYVVSSNLEASRQQKNMTVKSADDSPVKKLNSAGSEIMKRNGFFDPAGEVVSSDAVTAAAVSSVIDIAIGREEAWSILDNYHSRIFTYDSNGNLLFAFGDKGDQLGNGENVIGITYQRTVDKNGKEVYVLLLLDKGTNGNKLIPFTPSEYCDKIMAALHNQNEHEYSKAREYWQDVLTSNNNFDLAYIGIGKSLYSQGKYEEAMEYLSKAYETEYYALAFSKQQSSVLGKWLLVVVIGIVVLIALLVKFLGWTKKKNKAVSLKREAKTYAEELVFVFHVIFHPFDGFWDLKHEKRGSVRAGVTLLGITAIALFYNSIGQAYLFNPRGTSTDVLTLTAGLLFIVVLWVTANWCLTCLFDGEGSYKDIFIATCYAIAPMSFMLILSTVLTNFMTEPSIPNLLMGIGYVWCGLLLFFGMLTIHDYSLGKNLLITVCTLVAMIVILFVLLLFGTLVGKMVNFIISLVQEIGERV